MSDARERLRRLASAGREQRSAAAAPPVAPTATPRTEARLTERRVREALMSRGRFDALGLGLGVVAPMTAGVVGTWGRDEAEGYVVVLALGVVGGLLFLGARWLVGLGARAREEARLAALGFRVEGWFDVMGAPGPVEGQLHVELTFRQAPPAPEALAAAFKQVGADAGAGPGQFISRTFPAQPAPTRFVEFQWRLLHEVLRPLHALAPLERVTLRRERPGHG